jgi:hypothetical protein
VDGAGVGLWNNEKVAVIQGVDIHEGKHGVVLIDLYRGNLTADNLTEDAIHELTSLQSTSVLTTQVFRLKTEG